MENTIENILSEIKDKIYKDYTSFKIKPTYIGNELYQKIIFNLKNKDQSTYYNYKTKNCDTICVLDKGKRYIFFEDDIYDMTNKGIDSMTEKTIFD